MTTSQSNQPKYVGLAVAVGIAALLLALFSFIAVKLAG
jgi:hypothetical protein